MASCRLPRSITRRISKLTFYMQKIQKPDAVLTSDFWHFTRRGEKLGIRNEKLGQYRIILSADTVSEVRQMLSQKRR